MADNTALLAEAAAISQQTLNDKLKKEQMLFKRVLKIVQFLGKSAMISMN
jgi:hypothetical protein